VYVYMYVCARVRVYMRARKLMESVFMEIAMQLCSWKHAALVFMLPQARAFQPHSKQPFLNAREAHRSSAVPSYFGRH